MNKVYSKIFFFSFLVVGLIFGADTYEFDKAHTNIGFSVKHMVITNVKGNFKDYAGTIILDEENWNQSSIDVTIKAASIDTDNERRDKHLRSSDFFLVDDYPDITFKSNTIQKLGENYLAKGLLTIRGVSKEIDLPFKILGKVTDSRGTTRLGIEAELTINRQDFGISWNRTLDTGGLVASNEVKIELDVELLKK